MYLFDDLIEHSLRIIFPFADEDVSHSLGDEVKGLTVVFILVKMVRVVLEIDFWFSSLLLHLLKKKLSVLACSVSDLAGDINVCDEGPRDEEIV